MLVTLAVVVIELLRPAPAELMQVDSRDYLNFSATRTAGYPLFLRLVEHLPGGLDNLPWLQLAFYGAASLLLCSAFRRLSGSRIAASLVLLLLLGNPQVTRLSFMIMTESLFLSCLMLLLALYCRLVLAPRLQILAATSLVTGLAVLIRPAGYGLVVALPVVAWWCWRQGLSRWQTVLAAAVPYLAVLGAGMAAYHAEHGLWRTETFLGRTLLGKAAAVVDLTRPKEQSPVIAAIAARVAPDRAVIARAPTYFDRFRLLVPYYDIWRYHTASGTLLADSAVPANAFAAADRQMARVSLAIIAASPTAYLADLTLNYCALWWLPDAMTHTQLRHFRAFLAALGPLPDLGSYPAWHRAHSDVVIWALHGFMMMSLAASLWWGWRLLASAVCRVPLLPLARLGVLAGVLVHASFLLTAAVEAALPRYAWAMWPALSILFVSGLLACCRRVPLAIKRRWALRAL